MMRETRKIIGIESVGINTIPTLEFRLKFNSEMKTKKLEHASNRVLHGNCISMLFKLNLYICIFGWISAAAATAATICMVNRSIGIRNKLEFLLMRVKYGL